MLMQSLMVKFCLLHKKGQHHMKLLFVCHKNEIPIKTVNHIKFPNLGINKTNQIKL